MRWMERVLRAFGWCRHQSTLTSNYKSGTMVITETTCNDCGSRVDTPSWAQPSDHQILTLLGAERGKR